MDWMCDMGIAESREEAVAIGHRLVEFGLVDHVNSVFRHVPMFTSSVVLSHSLHYPSKHFRRLSAISPRFSFPQQPSPSPVRPQRTGLIEIFRFKDDILFFEFRSSTTVWPKATEMDDDAAKALALRIHMEIEASNKSP